jgi:hypothetical protein
MLRSFVEFVSAYESMKDGRTMGGRVRIKGKSSYENQIGKVRVRHRSRSPSYRWCEPEPYSLLFGPNFAIQCNEKVYSKFEAARPKVGYRASRHQSGGPDRKSRTASLQSREVYFGTPVDIRLESRRANGVKSSMANRDARASQDARLGDRRTEGDAGARTRR